MDGDVTMREPETAMPTRDAIMTVIGTLEAMPGACAATAPADDRTQPDAPAVADHDDIVAALQEMTAERDAWREEVLALRSAMMDEFHALRGEVATLSQTLASLNELARVRPEVLPTAATGPRRLSRSAWEDVPATEPGSGADEPDLEAMDIPSIAPERTPAHNPRRLGVGPVAMVPRPDRAVTAPPDPVRRQLLG
jgi:hypothetical protein